MSKAKIRASLYRSNCEAMRASRVDFPEPVGPRTSVCHELESHDRAVKTGTALYER